MKSSLNRNPNTIPEIALTLLTRKLVMLKSEPMKIEVIKIEEIEPLDNDPRSIYSEVSSKQNKTNEFLNKTYSSEKAMLDDLENKGYKMLSGTLEGVHSRMLDSLEGFDLKMHIIVNKKREKVVIGVLIGDRTKLHEFNIALKNWRSSRG